MTCCSFPRRGPPGGLHREQTGVSDSRSHMLWPAQVVRIFVHLVSADPEMVPALQQAHGLAALITLVCHEDSHPELAAAARQVTAADHL